MIKAIIIDGEEIKSPPIPYKHTFTTRGDHKVEYVTDDGIIPAGLLKGCKHLKSVNIKKSAKEIKQNAFAGSGLSALEIPENIQKIDLSSVDDCSQLENIQFASETVPEIVGTIASNIKVYVPVQSDESYRNALIGANIINSNDNVIQIRTSNLYILNSFKSTYYACRVIESKHRVHGTEEWIEDNLEEEMPWTEEDYDFLWKMSTQVLPDNWMCNNSRGIKEIKFISGITTIGRFTFQNVEGLTKIDLGNCVTTINYAGVSACKELEFIDGGANVTNLDKFAFFSLPKITDLVYMNTRIAYFPETQLGTVEILEGVEEVVLSWNCKADLIKLPSTCKYYSGHTHDPVPVLLNEGLETIDVFNQGNLNIHIPDSVITLDSWSINKQFTDEEIPKGVTSASNIHCYVRQNKVMKNAKVLFDVPPSTSGVYTIPDGIEFVCGWCFNSSNVTEVIIPSSVKTWEASFAQSKIQKIKFPDTIETYVMGASFQQCTNLQEVDFGVNFEECGGQLFGYCTNLKKLTLRNPNKVVMPGNYYGSAFYQWGTHELDALYVPAHLVDQYKNPTYGWTRVTKAILPITE